MQTLSKKRFQTRACIAGTKTLLMLFNILFWATGIILLIIGIWMKVSLSKFFEISEEQSFSLPNVFMVVGSTIIIVAFFACSCTANGNPRLLYLYGLFLFCSFIVITALALTGYAYRDTLKESLKTGLHHAIDEYENNNDNLDKIQKLFKCCGAVNYTDWENTLWANGTRSVPNSCCRIPKSCISWNYEDLDSIYQRGCYNEVIQLLNSNLNGIGLGALLIAISQIFGLILSCCLAKHINKAVYEQMS